MVMDSLLLKADTVISHGSFSGNLTATAGEEATVNFIMRTASPINWKHIDWRPVFMRTP